MLTYLIKESNSLPGSNLVNYGYTVFLLVQLLNYSKLLALKIGFDKPKSMAPKSKMVLGDSNGNKNKLVYAGINAHSAYPFSQLGL